MRLSRSPTFWKYQGGGSFSPAHSVGVPEPGSSSPRTDPSGSGMSQLSSQWTLCSVPSLPSLAAVELAPCSQVLRLPTMTLDKGLPALGWPSNLLHCRDPHRGGRPLTSDWPSALFSPPSTGSPQLLTHQGGAAVSSEESATHPPEEEPAGHAGLWATAAMTSTPPEALPAAGTLQSQPTSLSAPQQPSLR